MQSTPIDGERRQLIKLVGAGLALGTLGVGSATAGTGRYVVGTASRAATREARSKARSVHRVLDFGRYGQAVSGQFSREALEALARRSDVRYVEPVVTIHAYGQTLPWGIDRVDAEIAHANDSPDDGDTDPETGVGAKVAIIDTGIDYNHPDLGANYGGGVDYVNDDTDPMDDHGHGTHCAGIAAAIDNTEGVVGVAPAATLYGVKVLDSGGSGTSADVAAGIKWAGDNGMDVGSLSLGSRFSSSVIHDACKYAYGKGVLLVAAAGNDGPKGNSVGYPAAYAEVVAVSATTQDDALAFWSSKGPEVELAAPGSGINSTLPGGEYGSKSGTSMACPHVSGAGGLLMANGYSHTGARQQLRDTAEDLGLSADEQGHGLLNVDNALGLEGTSDDSGDTTAPSAPTLSEDGHTDTSVSLSWTTPSDSDLSGFNLYTKLSSDSTYAKEGTYDASTTSTTVSGLSSDTSYDFYVTAFDASGNESDPSNVVTAKTDASSGSTGDGTAPTIDRFDASEAGSPNPHANVTVDWAVSDTLDDGTAGNLSSVDIAVTDGGSYSDTHTHAPSGASASGSDSFEIKWGGNTTYDVTLTATDAAGNSTSQTKQVTAA